MIFRHLTIDCADPYELATFWSAVTGWLVSDGDEPGDSEVLVEGPAPVPGLLFIRVPESKTVKNRVHVDWMPTERTRDAEVERIMALGATLYEDHRTAEGLGWVTLLDPEVTSSVSSGAPPSVASRHVSGRQGPFVSSTPQCTLLPLDSESSLLSWGSAGMKPGRPDEQFGGYTGGFMVQKRGSMS